MRQRTPSRLLARLAVAAALIGPAPGAAAQASYQVGTAVAKLSLPVGVPLAGYSNRRTFPDVLGLHPYAHYFRPSTGGAWDNEDLRVKALVLELSGKKLLFVSLDIAGIERALRGEILVKINDVVSPDLSEHQVMISATHTHSGPGALSGNHFIEFAATDRLHTGVRDPFVAQVATTALAALGNLRPVDLFHFTKDMPQLHMNRARTTNPTHGDHRLSVLAARDKATHAWVGALVNFAVHGTAHQDANDRPSADYPGAIERALATAMGAAPATFPVLFLNGAEGDVKPTKGPGAMQGYLTPEIGAVASSWWGSAAPTPVPLPVAAWTTEWLDLELGNPFYHLRTELKPLQDVIPFSWLGMELLTYQPTQGRIWSIALGDIRFMTVPGEPTTDVGLELRKAAQHYGFPNTWILGLTNDHLGYFTSGTDWDLAEQEAAASVYGPYGSRRLVNGHICLLRTTCQEGVSFP